MQIQVVEELIENARAHFVMRSLYKMFTASNRKSLRSLYFLARKIVLDAGVQKSMGYYIPAGGSVLMPFLIKRKYVFLVFLVCILKFKK